MLVRYVLYDLVRNPRRTLSTMVGVTLGVGLFCGVLFFVDGLSASMTQRAVAPLPIDMQRIVTDRVGGTIELTQTLTPSGNLSGPDPSGSAATVHMELHNAGEVTANEVTIRSVPAPDSDFVIGSATVDGVALTGFNDNPFAHGAGQTGHNLGTVAPGQTVRMAYTIESRGASDIAASTVTSTFSTRESVNPVQANTPSGVPLAELARMLSGTPGVASARQLSMADLGSNTISHNGVAAVGPSRIFGFDRDYADNDPTIRITEGEINTDGAVLSEEAAAALGVTLGQTVSIALPDAGTLDLAVTGVADLSQARSLFSSRRGGDLETFIYNRNSVVVPATVFADVVFPSYERAASERGDRLKSPPIREVDIRLDREALNADPATALIETERVATAVTSVATHQDYLLDNISNTLVVAAADSSVAKKLFVFLGVPGGFLAAMLAAYAGTVLAEAQRREQATLRIRGASRRHLLAMLALRTSLLTGVGALVGGGLGYVAAVAILGRDTLDRASTASLLTSAVVGTTGGLLATGTALYLTGRRSIDRQINDDRAALTSRPPLWRRSRLDAIGMAVVIVGTVVALRSHAFDGESGSVYFGRSVKLNLALLVLPIAVWITGSLFAARLFGSLLGRSAPTTSIKVGEPLGTLYRLSIGRRPWAIGNGAIIVALIVALATSLSAFTSSYDNAKADDARFANGSDIRITPSPTAQRQYGAQDAAEFEVAGVTAVTPVIYGASNVILRSNRTSDPAGLVAIDPAGFSAVAPLSDSHFPSGDAIGTLQQLSDDGSSIILSREMAGFLKIKIGDTVSVLLARATDEQVEIELHVVDVFDRLPGFPDGADAVMSLATHTATVPAKAPDFFLATAGSDQNAAIVQAATALRDGPGAEGLLQIDTRLTTLSRDQSSLAALNVAGLVDLDSGFALAMAFVTIAIFVFGLLLQRRREYVTLRAQGLEPRTIRLLIAAEAGTVAVGGAIAGVAVGAAMGYYFVAVLRPLFVLAPAYTIAATGLLLPIVLVLGATVLSSVLGSRLVNGLDPTELLRDE